MPSHPSAGPSQMPRLYSDLAAWWPLLSAPDEYEEESVVYGSALAGACDGPLRTVLELGSGGGSNASFLKATLQLVLVDPAPGMLAVSRSLNPECEHIEGDMRTVRLDRQFDGVFVHDAVCYMTSEADLQRAIDTAFVHCRPGGAALFVPDYVHETFAAASEHGGRDAEDGRGLRYLAWTWDPDPTDTTYVTDYAYLLREADGTVRAESDRHIEGLFARGDWLRLLAEAGFSASMVPFIVAPGVTVEMFVGRRPR